MRMCFFIGQSNTRVYCGRCVFGNLAVPENCVGDIRGTSPTVRESSRLSVAKSSEPPNGRANVPLPKLLCRAGYEMLEIIDGSHAIIKYRTIDQIAGDGVSVFRPPPVCLFDFK